MEASQYIADLGTIAPEAFWPLKGPRPETITAYLVLQDAAAIFYVANRNHADQGS